MGGLACTPGGVLYLALEDSEERLQGRVLDIYPENIEYPITFSYQMACWTMPSFIEWVMRFKQVHRETKFVVVDTFGRISEDKGLRAGYKTDYQETARLQTMAHQEKLTLLMNHHTRKGISADPFEDISGTYGVTAAADTLMVLRRQPGEPDATLHIKGRDVEDQALSLRWEGCRWLYQGTASVVKYTEAEQEIIQALKGFPNGLTPNQLARDLEVSAGAIRVRLIRMQKRGLVKPGDDHHWMVT